jgi:hypothetical protein
MQNAAVTFDVSSHALTQQVKNIAERAVQQAFNYFRDRCNRRFTYLLTQRSNNASLIYVSDFVGLNDIYTVEPGTIAEIMVGSNRNRATIDSTSIRVSFQDVGIFLLGKLNFVAYTCKFDDIVISRQPTVVLENTSEDDAITASLLDHHVGKCSNKCPKCRSIIRTKFPISFPIMDIAVLTNIHTFSCCICMDEYSSGWVMTCGHMLCNSCFGSISNGTATLDKALRRGPIYID